MASPGMLAGAEDRKFTGSQSRRGGGRELLRFFANPPALAVKALAVRRPTERVVRGTAVKSAVGAGKCYSPKSSDSG